MNSPFKEITWGEYLDFITQAEYIDINEANINIFNNIFEKYEPSYKGCTLHNIKIKKSSNGDKLFFYFKSYGGNIGVDIYSIPDNCFYVAISISKNTYLFEIDDHYAILDIIEYVEEKDK